jgi:hypothetical protein
MLIKLHIVFIVGQEIKQIFFGFKVLGWFKVVRRFGSKKTMYDLAYSAPALP